MAKKSKLQRFFKSKYLIRRLVIITAMLLVVILMYSMIKNLFQNDDQLSVEENDTTVAITGEPTSELAVVTTSESNIGTSSVDQTLDTTVTETVATETTQQNIEETTGSNTEVTTVGQEVSMDFSKISFYIEKYNQRYNAYFKIHQSKTAEEVVLAVNMNHDFDFYTNIIPITEPGNLDVICNKYYQLSSNFTPASLVSVNKGYFVNDGKEYKLTQDALDAFIKMADAAKNADLSIKIISGYRSYAYQENLYNKYKANNGQAAADRFSARPGHSEHETGLAIDINDVSQSFENTREFVWLQENAYLYGYILRYPDGKEAVTGYMYEPWHYRFIGVELAKKVHDSGLTYDEYYAKYILK